ncbi:hypothetical protein EC07798_5060 [Escherichia coli 07798]|nr:hypothetical protein EC07798_5060 [Escherichia coli 07798]
MRFAVKSSDKCGGSRAEGNFRMKVIFLSQNLTFLRLIR